MILKGFAPEIGLRMHGCRPTYRIPGFSMGCTVSKGICLTNHIPGIRQVDLHPCIRRPISNAKPFRTMEILVDLCFLDIVVTLPSLPTHYSRRKLHLKTRGFSTFWEFSVFSLGNPTVMKINEFSIENQWVFNKISLNIWLCPPLGSDTVTEGTAMPAHSVPGAPWKGQC